MHGFLLVFCWVACEGYTQSIQGLDDCHQATEDAEYFLDGERREPWNIEEHPA